MKQHHTWSLVTLSVATLAAAGSLYAQQPPMGPMSKESNSMSSSNVTSEQMRQMAEHMKAMSAHMDRMVKQMQQRGMQMENLTQDSAKPAKKGCCGKSSNMDQASKDIKKMDMDMDTMDKDMDMDRSDM